MVLGGLRVKVEEKFTTSFVWVAKRAYAAICLRVRLREW